MADNLYFNGSPSDGDGDGLTDQGEQVLFFTDPAQSDSDGDGYLDGTEVLYGTDPLDRGNPMPVHFSSEEEGSTIPLAWYVARASGLVSYALLFLVVFLGIGLSSKFIYKVLNAVIAVRLHRIASMLLLVFVAIHLISLKLDHYLAFSFADLLIPFHSNFQPFSLSLGIFGFYLLCLLVLTSVFFMMSRYKLWRFLHYLSYPAFWILFFHGFLIGTDTAVLGVQIFYALTAVLVLGASFYRLVQWIQLKRIKAARGPVLASRVVAGNPPSPSHPSHPSNSPAHGASKNGRWFF